MGNALFERSWVLLMLGAPLAGCASAPAPSPHDLADANDTGQLLAPGSPTERAILERLSTLPSRTPERVAGTDVVAEPTYTAASGRSCRALHLARSGVPTLHRVACRTPNGWAFVPDVFGGASVESAE